MIPATTRGATLPVVVVLVILFSVTAAMNGAYHATRQSRAEALYRSGLELAGAGKNAQAVEEFRAALTYVHNDTQYRMALARSLIALGRWGEAESYLSELREDDPTSGPINLMLARIAVRDRRDPDAATFYQRAIYGLWPDHPAENRTAVRFELVGLLEREGQEKQVLAELLDLADEAPDTDYASRQRIAELLLAHGSPEHAEELFQGILENKPNDAAAEKGRADSLFALGNYLDALRAYHTAEYRGLKDTAVTERIAACEAVIRLDPTLVRLSAGQRFKRAQELVRLTMESAQTCGQLPPDLTATAQKAAGENATRRRDGDTLTMLSVAEQLWNARQDLCGGSTKPDPPLAAVMAKLQKQ
jgi:tetratricopeptide (TPR) repeat protein